MMNAKILSLVVTLLVTSQSFCIDVKEAIPIGGIQQWITVSGEPQKPLLLFLHGGPGNSVMGYANRFTSQLQKHFLIVHWDQRESGKTAELNRTDKPLTVSLMVSDAVELIQYLKQRFNKEKIYLMGQSWGGFLALEVAIAAPELLEACLAVSPMIYQDESERLSLAYLIKKAQMRGDTLALKELNSVQVPFQSPKDVYFHRKWLAIFDKRNPPIDIFVLGWCQTWLPLFQEASHVNYMEMAPRLDCPIYFFIGRNDLQTHAQLAENYFQLVTAPDKKFFLFKRSSHSPHLKESELFQERVLSILKIE
jgi:pimeloyl-ACP methyl ester carboxylesterase